MSINTEIDKDKIKQVYKKGLVSLEIMKLKEGVETPEEAEVLYKKNVTDEYFVINDLSKPFMIKLSYTNSKQELRSVDPDSLNEADKYEISESIQEILKSGGFPIIDSNFPKAEDADE